VHHFTLPLGNEYIQVGKNGHFCWLIKNTSCQYIFGETILFRNVLCFGLAVIRLGTIADGIFYTTQDMFQIKRIRKGFIGMSEFGIESTTPIKLMVSGHGMVVSILTPLIGFLIDADKHFHMIGYLFEIVPFIKTLPGVGQV